MADISKVEIGGVSYNVKDAAAREMIKNLPTGGGGGASSWKDLGEGFGEGVLLEETTLTEQSTQIDKELGLVVETVYTVNWNGTEYTPTAVDASAMVGVTGAVVLGMSSKYPFTILAKPGNGVSISIDSGSEPVTVSISGLGNTIIPIPGKYLPKGTPWIEEGGMVEILPECQPTYDGEEIYLLSESALPLIAGETYVVNWNGVEYSCVAQDAGAISGGEVNGVFLGNCAEFGLPDTGEPFVVLVTDGFSAAMPLDGTTELTISIVGGGTTIHKIDNRCLPDTMLVSVDLINKTASKNCAEIWGAMQNKQNVFLTVPAGENTSYMPCIYCMPNKCAVFIAPGIVSDGDEITSVTSPSPICVKADGSVLI